MDEEKPARALPKFFYRPFLPPVLMSLLAFMQSLSVSEENFSRFPYSGKIK